ncbi:MAG: Na+/H+ antiporter NhaC [Bacillota bacterium]
MAKKGARRKPYLWEALLCIAFLVISLYFVVIRWDRDPHMALVISAVFATLVALRTGISWDELETGLIDSIYSSVKAILILLVVGMLIGIWILGGVVQTFVYYSLLVLSPKIFLVIVCILCAITSLATGSSWATAGTVGIAAIGVGQGMGIPLAMVGGAVISGAYFGDKMSPVSDTTNLAPAVSESKLFDHIYHMVYTVMPSMIIALIAYTILGFSLDTGASEESIKQVIHVLGENYNISPMLLIPPLAVIAMVIFKLPLLPSFMGGVFLGVVGALIFQGASLAEVITVMHYGYVGETGVEVVDVLLSRGGFNSMLWLASVILCSLTFGGILEKVGILEVIIAEIFALVESPGSLIMSNVLCCILTNALTADQYLAIIVPGRIYKSAYEQRKLHTKNLSRVLEDSGTMTSSLIPWSSCGAFMAGTLGVATLAYAPFAFLVLLNPLVSVIYGYTGITMEKVQDGVAAGAAVSF